MCAAAAAAAADTVSKLPWQVKLEGQRMDLKSSETEECGGFQPRGTKLPLQVKASSGDIWPQQDGKCGMLENKNTGTARRQKDKIQGSWKAELAIKR